MASIDELLKANDNYSAARLHETSKHPRHHVAILTCMDSRIDVLGAFGLYIGDAHILRNAGGRVTDDVLRSLALSAHILDVTTVLVMHHTKCSLLGASDEELDEVTSSDVRFLPIEDNEATLRADIELIASTPYLAPITSVSGLVFELTSGSVEELVRWERPL